MKTVTAVLACLVACAVYIPAAFIVGRNHIPRPCPQGVVTEKIGDVHSDYPDRHPERSHMARTDRSPDTSGIAECQSLTVPTDHAYTPDSGTVIRFETGDGSRQRSNEGYRWDGVVGAEDILNVTLAMCALYAFVRLVMLGIKR